MPSIIRRHVDWILLGAATLIVAAGLVTMDSFTSENYFFTRQLIWVAISIGVCLTASYIDWRLLRNSWVLVGFFVILSGVLLALILFGSVVKGAQSWFQFASVAFQPVDFVKLLVIIILAKYFSRRHIEISQAKHIIISGIYALIPFVLVLLQPDFGGAIIIFFIWLGMIMVSGISKKHLGLVFLVGMISFGLLWGFAFKDYQKKRIMTFLQPLSDIHGAGYNAFQSQVAVGSGQLFGKGVGYGTQSRLSFLPEYETDFIFAAFAEEWGFFGVLILFGLFAVIVWRILSLAMIGASNFETLFAMGLAIYFMSHFFINVGMNIGLLPVTGITLPFMSYGGSHLLAEFLGIGILMGMRRYARAAHREDMKNEFVGVV